MDPILEKLEVKQGGKEGEAQKEAISIDAYAQ